jgi:hypothetical protein
MSAVLHHPESPVVMLALVVTPTATPSSAWRLAARCQRMQHNLPPTPLSHAYRLSQVISYGHTAPQTYVH